MHSSRCAPCRPLPLQRLSIHSDGRRSFSPRPGAHAMAVKAASKQWGRGSMLYSDEAREESDMRRKLILKARKGDRKAQDRLYELYKVRFYCGGDLPTG